MNHNNPSNRSTVPLLPPSYYVPQTPQQPPFFPILLDGGAVLWQPTIALQQQPVLVVPQQPIVWVMPTPTPVLGLQSANVTGQQEGETVHHPNTTHLFHPPLSVQFAQGFRSASRVPDVSKWGFAVADPMNTSLQRFPVAPTMLARTRGMLKYNCDPLASSMKPCASSICVHFARNGGCPDGNDCKNFHVEPSYLNTARSAGPLCCALHNDYFTQEMLFSNCAPNLALQKFMLVLDDRAEVELSIVQLGFTIGLEQLSHRGFSTTQINLRKHVCRLHFEGKCKWTKDCGHVHLCRELQLHIQTSLVASLVLQLNSNRMTSVGESGKIEDVSQLHFIRCWSIIPLVSNLIDANKVSALSVLVRSGLVVTEAQRHALLELEIHEAADCQKAELNTKIEPFCRPKLSRVSPGSM